MRLLFYTLVGLFLISCINNSPNRPEDTGTILCEVYGKRLFYNDVRGVIPPAMNTNDSIIFMKSYVERWIKDALLLHEAELNTPIDLDIDKLIQDYRSSLLMVNYEKQLIETKLNSFIDTSELRSYYESHIDDYILPESIAQIALFKPEIKNKASRAVWEKGKKDGLRSLEPYCGGEESYCFLDRYQWLPLSEINSLLPSQINSQNWLKKGELSVPKAYLHIFELHLKSDPAPMDYVEEEIRRSLMHDKRSELINNRRNELYQNELDKTNVKNYVQ